MSLSTRLDKIEAAMRGHDPPDRPRICRRLIYDPREWQIEEAEAISRMKTDELDRLVAAGTIKEIDREHVRFIVRRIVQPAKWPDEGVRGVIPRSSLREIPEVTNLGVSAVVSISRQSSAGS
jgi:hypothetical protein